MTAKGKPGEGSGAPAPKRPSESEPHGVPPITISEVSTRVNKTGSWKYIRPQYQDKVAPCNQGCPVGVDIEGYMNLLRENRVDEAIELLLRENPLPAVTGRVCYHPCENACNRRVFDEAVSIHAVERMLGDQALDAMTPAPTADRRSETVAVVGSGPAGLACAYHLARLGYEVTVYESDAEPGGVLRYGIPEYRLPKAVLAREIDRIRRMGVQFRTGIRIGRDLTWRALDRFDAVFIATGAAVSRSLGEEFQGVAGIRSGLEFLKEVSSGPAPAIGKKVVVVGGGNTAIDCARTALRLGAETMILYRRTRDEMPANAEEIDDAIAEGIAVEYLAAPLAPTVEEISPDDDPLEAIRAMFGSMEPRTPVKKLTGLRCVRMTLGDPDDSGRRRPIPVVGSEFFVPADLVLTALGEDADLENLPQGVRHDGKVIRANNLGDTHRTIFFAGGDVIDQPHTVAYALGSGKRAAVGIDHFLKLGSKRDGSSPDLGALQWGEGNVSMSRWAQNDPVERVNPVNRAVTVEELNFNHFRHVPRHRDGTMEEARTSFSEANRGLDREDALGEAGRCFNCAVCNSCELCLIYCPDMAISYRADGKGFEINYDYCKGCGVCSFECPRGAVTMTREGL